MHPRIRIRDDVATQLLTVANASPTVECCGLLAGRDGLIELALPATNVAANPATTYEIAPEELFRLVREMRADRLAFLGIYHSHPRSSNEPSPADIARAYYPDAAYLIVSPQTQADAPRPIRAFSIREGVVAELALEIVD